MKKNILTFFTLLISGLSFAQLTVKDNAYIFIDGDGFASGTTVAPLFVADDVRIESTSNIYLRNNAQIIQGSGTTGNSGTGKLSLYQEGTVNNYAYNYWASPVGEISADNTNNREFIVGDVLNDATGLITNVPAVIFSDWDGISSPLSIADRWLWSFSPGTLYADWDYIGDGTSLDPGYGFTMKGSTGSNNQRYDFAGKPNTGDIDVNVLAEQFTLVGNPYPSALDIHSFVHDTDNSSDMMGSLLFWEHDPTVNSHILTDYVGGYASYTVNAAGTMGTFVPAMFATLGSDGFPTGPGTASTSGKIVGQYLPIAQGFMIEGRPSADIDDGVVTFKNSYRTYYKETGAASEFFKTGNQDSQNLPNISTEFQYNQNGFQIIPSDYRRFRLNVDFDDEVSRPLVHNFHATATDGFDYGLECKFNQPNPRDAYFILGDMPFVAQAHQYDIDLRIPLIVKADTNLPLKVRIYDIQNFNNEPIYIYDANTDEYYDLTASNFNINIEAGTYTDRFEITFTNSESTLSTDNFIDSGLMVFQNNTISQLVITNPESLSVKSVSLVDISGKQIFKKSNLNNSTRYEFTTKNLSDGVYVATITLENNSKMNKKIVIKNN